ncbi:MAG TPA: hypothetical protein VLH35_06100 [Candidatus Acidoferrales bacterium]|nr:hypothetical protein [Candidatus Acidoferrales bacterium]
MTSTTSKVLLIAILGAVACLSTVSYISNPSTAETTIQTISGEKYSLSGQFSILSNNEIMPTSKTIPASRTINWSNQSSAHTQLTQGHWQLSVTVKMNANAEPNTPYMVTLQDASSASPVSIGEIHFVTSDTINSGEMMNFVFDIGAEIDSSMAFVAQIV